MLSSTFLVLGVLAYGMGAARLSVGSQGGAVNAVRSRIWWIGTSMQGAGFLFTLVARRDLPMLLVQTCVVTAVAVTAVIEHLNQVRPMTKSTVLGVGLLMLGVSGIVVASEPGPTPSPTVTDAAVLLAGTVLTLFAIPVDAHGARASLIYGSASGLGFGVGAVAARILMADAAHPLWFFWQLPWQSWLVGLFVPIGLFLGQIHLTRGLARGTSTPVLGCMYGAATILAALLGRGMLNEVPRPGTLPYMLVGLAIGTVGTWILLRHEANQPVTGS